MKHKINILLIYLLSFLCFSFVIFTTFREDGYGNEYSKSNFPDLSSHAIYSKYDFNNTEHVVNLGTQPFFLPTGFITELMKRDTILHDALSESGIEVRFFPFLKGNDVNFFLRRDDIDVGIGGDMPTITAAATMDITVSSIIQQGFTSIVARHPMLIRDLKGKNIAYAIGSNAHYALLRALSSDGLNEEQVHLIPMDVNKMPAALMAGEIEAFSAWEPTPSITLLGNPESAIIHKHISSGFMYFSKPFSESHPEIVRQIVAAEIRALKWIKSSRQNLLLASELSMQSSNELTNQNMGLTVDQNSVLAEGDIIGLSSMPSIPRNDLRQDGPLHMEFKLLKNLGKIPDSAIWEKVHKSFDLQIIIDILADYKKYRLNEFNYSIE